MVYYTDILIIYFEILERGWFEKINGRGIFVT